MPSTNADIIEALKAADPNRFASCIAYAKAFNTLDPRPLNQVLADDSVYGSQVVLEELQGKKKVLAYLEGKIEALRKVGTQAEVVMEVAGSPQDARTPGLIVAQRSGADSVLERVAWLDLHYTECGLIERLWMCTVAPHFSQAVATGCFPGR